MKEPDTGSYLSSRIGIRVKLLTSMAAIRQKLKSYPHLKQVGYGSKLRYVVELENADKFYIISLTESEFLFELYSKTSPLYFIQEVLLRIISLAAILSDDCEFGIRDIFPYLVEALANQIPRPQVIRTDTNIRETAGEIILARRINGLNRENSQLGNDLSLARSELLKMTSLFIISRYGPNVDINEVTKESGIAADDITKALKFMPEVGYRALPLGHDRFNLVRL